MRCCCESSSPSKAPKIAAVPDPLRLADSLALITGAMAREVGAAQGVCGRPLIRRVLDRDTGTDTQMAIPCGSTRERVCPCCAVKARQLRINSEPKAGTTTPNPRPPAITTRTLSRRMPCTTRPTPRPVMRLGHGGRARPDDGRTHRTSLGCRSRTARSAKPTSRRRVGSIGRRFPHADPALLRCGAGRCAGRLRDVRLPPCRVGCGGVSAAGRPVLAEPAPDRRVSGAVLRRR